jgi:hypothetical protein
MEGNVIIWMEVVDGTLEGYCDFTARAMSFCMLALNKAAKSSALLDLIVRLICACHNFMLCHCGPSFLGLSRRRPFNALAISLSEHPYKRGMYNRI